MDFKQKMILNEVGKKLEETDNNDSDKARKFVEAVNSMPQHLQAELHALERESDNWTVLLEKCSNELLHALDKATRSVYEETAEN